MENTLKGDGSEMGVKLKFNSMEDFEPAEVVQQVEPLRKLLETRDKLRDLLTKVDRSRRPREPARAGPQEQRPIKKLSSDLGIPASEAAREE